MLTPKDFEFNDLQGIFRFSHSRLQQARFLLLKIQDATLAKQWLAQAPVTSGSIRSPLPNTALHIAFTAEGLHEIGLKKHIINGFSNEFLSGMTGDNRSRRLGDTAENDPQSWHWGTSSNNKPDLLLMLYADSENIDTWQQQLTSGIFYQAFTLQTSLNTNGEIASEPFGFADGISQPVIDWQQQQSVNIHQRDTYSNLVAPGEIILGYPNEYNEYTDRPLLNTENDELANILPDAEEQPHLKDFGRNGSYLIFRQLEQDVPGFWQFIDKETGGNPSKREKLAQAMVGRTRNGDPLVPLTQNKIAGISSHPENNNHFHFDDDPDGLLCPMGAHVRRSNPRTGDFTPGVRGFFSRIKKILGFDNNNHHSDLLSSTRFHRLLRRGRQYGPVLTPEEAIKPDASKEERGLQFICLSANIARQFEFVQNAWLNNAKFAGLQNETDPLLGNRQKLDDVTPTDNFSQAHRSGPRRCTNNLPQFVRVRGGAYFFLPGIRALKYIARSTTITSEGEA
ncbi:MAG: hypothetical protein JKY66_10835 [Spongiibacteraceae bacterium]|nr:hypothetical protein [Spongiibacteraceae bacterium]